MANSFETSILCRKSSVNNRIRPLWSDASFWSEVLISKPDSYPPIYTQYTLQTDTGDELVDNNSNQIVAAS